MEERNRVSSESEEIILQIIEENSPLTMRQIVERASQVSGWSDSTIKTFVRRLVKKGIVTEEKRDVIYFSPAQSKSERSLSAMQSVIDKFYGSSYKLAAMNFIENNKLTREELQELIDYLEEN